MTKGNVTIASNAFVLSQAAKCFTALKSTVDIDPFLYFLVRLKVPYIYFMDFAPLFESMFDKVSPFQDFTMALLIGSSSVFSY